MTRIDKDFGRVAALLQKSMEHLVPHQPLLTQSIRREIDSVPLTNPPRVGHLTSQLDSSGWGIHRVKADVLHVAAVTGAGYRFVPPFLI
jgi:hypothetical protein